VRGDWRDGDGTVEEGRRRRGGREEKSERFNPAALVFVLM